MRVEWLEKALKNLEDEASYIALGNSKAADDFSDAIFASVDKLAQFPTMGREGRVKNTREWAVPNWSYLILYRVRGDRDADAPAGQPVSAPGTSRESGSRLYLVAPREVNYPETDFFVDVGAGDNSASARRKPSTLKHLLNLYG